MKLVEFSLILSGVLLNACAQLLLKAGTNRIGHFDFSLNNATFLALTRESAQPIVDALARLDENIPAESRLNFIRNADELARTVVATREGVPVTLDQVASVRTGQAIRMGSASENFTPLMDHM